MNRKPLKLELKLEPLRFETVLDGVAYELLLTPEAAKAVGASLFSLGAYYEQAQQQPAVAAKTSQRITAAFRN